jgi:hypothetical protein
MRILYRKLLKKKISCFFLSLFFPRELYRVLWIERGSGITEFSGLEENNFLSSRVSPA